MYFDRSTVDWVLLMFYLKSYSALSFLVLFKFNIKEK